MRRCALMLVLSASACAVQTPANESAANPPGAPTERTVTLGTARYEVGHTMVVEQREGLDLTPDGIELGEPAFSTRSVARRREQVVEIADGRPTVVRVVWDTNEAVSRIGGQEKREPSVLVGEYIIARKGGPIHVERPDGSPISAAEQEQIFGAFEQPGYVRLLEGRLAGRTLSSGWSMDVDTRTSHDGADRDHSRNLVVHLAYEGTRVVDGHEHAMFATEAKQDGAYGHGEVDTVTKGSAIVDVEHGWLLSIEYGGPMRIAGTAGELGVQRDYGAAGRWFFSMTIEHGSAAVSARPRP